MTTTSIDADEHTEQVDMLVIGWGKAGKTLAKVAAGRGLRVALVEESSHMIGGACINVACIPTKILVHDAEQRRAGDDVDAYLAATIERRDTLTGAMREANHRLLADLDQVMLVQGHATFTGPRTVLVEGGPERLHLVATTVIINTGTRPATPPIPGAAVGARVHNSITIQHVAPLPRTLVVIGGGDVGLELASTFAHLGSDVTVLDRGPRPLRHEDDDVAETAAEILADNGVTFVPRATVTKIDPGDSERRAQVTWHDGDDESSREADAVLVALGREPTTDTLGLATAGVAVDDRGYVVVDEHLRTSAAGVYAVGDINGGPQFTYISFDDHRIVADHLFGEGRRSTTDRVAVPRTTYLTPPLSRVGLTEADARDHGYDVRVAFRKVAQIAAAPRAKTEGDPRGLVKIIVDSATDLVLGAALLHVHSEELINFVALAMRHGVTASELRDGIYTHPSTTEALNEVLTALTP